MISVIVPVYQVREGLPYCVKSLCAQTHRPLEVILVDDGSTDGSEELCDAFAASEPCVRTFHQANAGPSAARNAGVAAAQGEWVCFVDGDDIVPPHFLSELLRAAQAGAAQAAVCGMQEVTDYAEVRFPKTVSFAVLPAEKALRRMLYQKGFDVSVCGKLVRREIALRCPFPVGRYFEDVLTMTQMLCAAQRVAVLRRPLYGYYQRTESTMHSVNLKARQDEADMTRAMLAFVKEHCPAVSAAARSKAFSNSCQILSVTAVLGGEAEALRASAKRYMRENAGRVLTDPGVRFKNRGAAALAVFCPSVLLKKRTTT